MSALVIYLKEIYTLMGRHKKSLPLLIILGLVLGMADICGLSLVIEFLASVLGQSQSVPLLSKFSIFFEGRTAGLMLIPLFIIRTALGIYSFRRINSIAGIVEADLRADLLIRYQYMPYAERLKRGEAEFVNAINIWTTQYARGVLIPLARFISDATVGLMVIIYLACINWYSFAFFTMLIGSMGLVYDRALRKRGQIYAKRYRELSSQVISDVQQCLEGYKEIRVIGLENYFQEKLRHDATRVCEALANSNTIAQSPRYIIEAVVVFFVVISLSFMGTMSSHASYMLPLLAAFAVGGLRVVALTSLASGTSFHLRVYRQVIQQLMQDYSIVPAMPSAKLPESGDKKFTALDVKNVSFAYAPSSPPVIRQASFSIAAGENLVILGPSGCGKTTLVDLLLGIIQPDCGAIEVHCDDGQTRPNLVGIATYLSQTTFILNDSLRRNIALGCEDYTIDDARVIAALNKAKLPQFTQDLDMVLGDRGNKISGGQRQRVALARAFYLNRNVLILDEATNALDLQTEIEIISDLLSLKDEITLITVTHRLEIAKLFSRQMVFSEGKLEQSHLRSDIDERTQYRYKQVEV